jgi:hypothetical protein
MMTQLSPLIERGRSRHAADAGDESAGIHQISAQIPLAAHQQVKQEAGVSLERDMTALSMDENASFKDKDTATKIRYETCFSTLSEKH